MFLALVWVHLLHAGRTGQKTWGKHIWKHDSQRKCAITPTPLLLRLAAAAASAAVRSRFSCTKLSKVSSRGCLMANSLCRQQLFRDVYSFESGFYSKSSRVLGGKGNSFGKQTAVLNLARKIVAMRNSVKMTGDKQILFPTRRRKEVTSVLLWSNWILALWMRSAEILCRKTNKGQTKCFCANRLCFLACLCSFLARSKSVLLASNVYITRSLQATRRSPLVATKSR